MPAFNKARASRSVPLFVLTNTSTEPGALLRNDVSQAVLHGLLGFDHFHFQIDPYSLAAVFFMAVYADERRQNQILHKDPADRLPDLLLGKGI